MRYDVAIIGTGPAGLEAAITCKIRNKNIILIGNKSKSEKVGRSEKIENYLGIPSVSGADLNKAFTRHIEALDIEITDVRVANVYSMGDYFALQCGEDMIEASAVILAPGVLQSKELPGENELLGRGVSYCATCDAALYKGKTAAVVSYGAEYESEADFLAERADKVYYYPIYKTDEVHFNHGANIEIIRGEAPKSVEKVDNMTKLTTNKGELLVNGVFFLRSAVAPDKLVPGLATENGHIKVDRTMATNLPGLFAAGDATGEPYQVIKAAGEGNVAALSAVRYLDRG
jgi:thioredoxin reductase (NADPH)